MRYLKNLQVRPLILLGFSVLMLLLFINRDSSYTLPAEYRWTIPTIVETYVSSDWMMPKLNGEYRFRKPPAAYWSMLLFSKVFSLKLFWLRFPVVIFSVLSIMLFYLMLSQLELDKNTVMTGSIMLLSLSGFYTYSRIADLEIPMLFFSLGVYYGMFRLLIKEDKKGLLISAFFLGLTLLTKSHATFVSYIFFLLMWSIRYRDWNIFTKNKKEWMLFIVIFLMVSVPWYLYTFIMYKSELLSALKNEMLYARSHGSYNLAEMLVGILTLLIPYVLFFLYSLYKSLKKNSREEYFFLLYFISIILPYMFTANQKMRYMVPLLPACIALISLYIYADKKQMSSISGLSGLLFVLVPGITISAFILWFRLLPIYTAVIILVISVYAFFMYRKNYLLKAVVLTGLLEFMFIGVVYPELGLWHVPDEVVAQLAGKEVATLNRRPFFLPVHLKHPPLTDVTWWANIDKAVENNALIYVPSYKLKKFESTLKAHGYSQYSKKITWRRFNEFPKNRDVIKALKDRDIDVLKVDTYFIGDIQ